MIFFLPLTFLLWLFAFRGFLTGELGFTSDAVSYYNHIKFYIDSLAQGVFPLWDPLWSNGVPNDFFLRRFGAYNPLFLIILIFNKIGIPYLFSYLSFLAIYYFIGMVGFYKLAQRLFQNNIAAFTAYLLLMFSSVGTRLFDSYLLLIIVPGIWFFYCLVGFAQTQKKHYFLGVTFAFMVLATTYIPFYFLIIFGMFLFWFSIFYSKNLITFFKNFTVFFKNNKILVVICVLAAILSFLPGLLFMQESSSGSIALPQRNFTSSESHQLSVGLETITSWGILEDITYSIPFLKDITTFKFAVLYVPPFALVILLLGLFSGMTKRLVFLFVWGISLFVMFSPHAPVYHFLHKYVFFFKYFRNLHFFLWFALVPIFVLFVAEQMRGLCRGKPIRLVLFLLTILIAAHPLYTYHYLNKNSAKAPKAYQYDKPYLKFSFINSRPSLALYYATPWYQKLVQDTDPEILSKYLQYKFIVYDQAWTRSKEADFKIDGIEGKILFENTAEFQVTHYDGNSIKIKTNFSEEKFLVYNDNFHPKWQAFINGKKMEILRTHIAFKGLHIPAGKNEVYLRYGSVGEYMWNYFLLLVFYGMFLSYIFLWVRDSRYVQK
ncbi:hypothetical protein MNBD_UNCLBAC01-1653 [hydrothermal vent metagenome]|uniref:Membrane protein 6-pyruvoyl-tetrahydropterin synthase-related domain-containing protein n=1 Tax=hydrothermal vent metagenome TaxID=652676 RepID=A0A3B1DNI8_9ZZZZ